MATKHPEALERILAREEFADLAGALRESVVPGFRCREVRTVNLSPPGFLRRLRGGGPPEPELGILDSKMGGLPFRPESDPPPKATEFIAQINFADLETEGTSLPDTGLLGIDLHPGEGMTIRWYPEPNSDEHRAWEGEFTRGWEHRVEFIRAWSFRFDLIDEVLDRAQADAPDDPATERLERARDHAARWSLFSAATVGGYLPCGLDGPGPRQWLTQRIACHPPYIELFRIEDSGTGMQLGDFNISVIIGHEDLAEGRLGRACALCWQ